MRYAYPNQITLRDGREFVVSFPDVAGALTGANDRDEALELAWDALAGALAGYVERRAAVPVPSPVLDRQQVVAVDPVAAAKLEVYSAIRDQGITKHALAERLGLSDTTVGRLTRRHETPSSTATGGSWHGGPVRFPGSCYVRIQPT